MIHKVIPKTEFKRFIGSLIDENETFGPKRIDTRPDGQGIYQFKEVGSFDEMDLDYTVTYSSVKNFFLPFMEELSRFDFSDKGWDQSVEYRVNPRVIVGVRPCDINALNILDKILIGGNYPSPYYKARRTNTFLVGMDHEPLDDCFCESLGHDTVHRGFHLFCTDIGDSYYLTINSPDAFGFLKNFEASEPTNADSEKFLARRNHTRETCTSQVKLAGLPSVLYI